MEAEPGARHSRRVVVASYESYPEAQRAVDYLSDRRFPVERVAIVAEDLRFVEQVTGRMGYGQAALQGAGLGALIGLVFGFFLGLFSLFNPLISAIYLAIIWLIYGAIIGLIVGLIGHALSGGQRDFSSIEGIQAGRYNVMVDEEVADEASELLAGLRPSSGEAGMGTASEPHPRAEEVPPREEPVTREAPLNEEGPERRGAAPPSTDTPREASPASEEQPQRPGEEQPPRTDEEPPRRTPPPPAP